MGNVSSPLISTRLQPGVALACEGETVSTVSRPLLQAVETAYRSPTLNTRLKPGANESESDTTFARISSADFSLSPLRPFVANPIP